MRENLYNEDDPDLITKKFRSHIKSNSKSCRLPETMHLNSTFRENHQKRPNFSIIIFMISFLAHPTII